MNHSNIDKGLEIAKKLNIKIPEKYMIRVIKYREIKKELIKKWKRKKKTTFCGQYTSEYFQDAGFDMSPILRGKNFWNINTTGQYSNALKSVKAGDLIEVTPEQAFYLCCIARDTLVLSSKHMIVNGKPYNHAAVTWPVFTKSYDKNIGPVIAQQGWFSLIAKPVSHKYAWGKNWTNPMVKYFLPDLK